MIKSFFHIAVLVFCFAAFFSLSCNQDKSGITPTTDSIKTVSEAIARWHSMHIHNYSFNQTRQCWYPSCGDSVRVVVRTDTIYSMIPINPGSVTTEWCKTVDGLFEFALFDTLRWIVYAEFDQFYGFPKVVFIQSKPPPYTEGGFTYFNWDFNY